MSDSKGFSSCTVLSREELADAFEVCADALRETERADEWMHELRGMHSMALASLSSREAVLEEAAKVCDRLTAELTRQADAVANTPLYALRQAKQVAAERCAYEIRERKDKTDDASIVTNGWQPIETAPTNKTMVALLRVEGPACRYGVGWYMPLAGWQAWDADRPPTHWTPLPATPAQSKPEERA